MENSFEDAVNKLPSGEREKHRDLIEELRRNEEIRKSATQQSLIALHKLRKSEEKFYWICQKIQAFAKGTYHPN